MAEIVGLDGMTGAELARELDRGGKFVVFQYTVSIILMTFKRSSSIHFIKGGESSIGKSLPFTLLTLVLGWWGFPWGPIYSIMSLVTNFGGGKDVTNEVRSALLESA